MEVLIGFMAVVILTEFYIILVLASKVSILRDRLLKEIKESTLMQSKYQRSRMPIEMTEVKGARDAED